MPSLNRVAETWIFADRSLGLERRWRNSESGKPPQFFKKNWGAVWGMCETLCLFRPDSGKAVLSSGTVAIDQLQPVALADELVKGCLVICGSQPCRACQAGALAILRKIAAYRTCAPSL